MWKAFYLPSRTKQASNQEQTTSATQTNQVVTSCAQEILCRLGSTLVGVPTKTSAVLSGGNDKRVVDYSLGLLTSA